MPQAGQEALVYELKL